jgi:hypothetical protein
MLAWGMSYEFYKVLHLFGIALILLPIGGLIVHATSGGTKVNLPNRKFLFITHGVGLLIAFVAGFGLMARLGVSGFPGWIILKILIWLAFGGAVTLALKAKTKSHFLIWVFAALVAAAAFLARVKGI